MNFFNPIHSSSQSDIEEYHFCIWWILKKIFISFLFNQTKRHMTNVFSLHDKDHTSNQSQFPTMTLFSTSFFQQLFIFQQFEPSFSFTFNLIIAFLKCRHSLSSFPPNNNDCIVDFPSQRFLQMNRLSLSISCVQFKYLSGMRERELREGEE